MSTRHDDIEERLGRISVSHLKRHRKGCDWTCGGSERCDTLWLITQLYRMLEKLYKIEGIIVEKEPK